MAKPAVKELIFDKTLHPPQSHHATLAIVGDEIVACWYSCSYEGSADTVLYMSRRPLTAKATDQAAAPSGHPWSEPEVIVDLPGMPVGNPVLFYHEDVLRLFYVVLYSDWWTEARIVETVSQDGGRTWSHPRLLREELGLMTKTAPLVVGNRILLPVYDERKWCPMVLVSDDGGKTWQLVGDTTARGVAIQPKIVPLSDGRLLMYTRTTKGKVYESYSYNEGLTWIASQPTEIPNPNSGIELVRLATGSLVLICNDTPKGRGRLSVLLSPDEGKTWPYRQVIEDSEGEFSYPFAVVDENDTIHLAYTIQRQRIGYMQFDEAWVRGE